MQVESIERDAAAYLRTAVKALEKACALNDTDASRNALEATQSALAYVMHETKRAERAAQIAALSPEQRAELAALIAAA